MKDELEALHSRYFAYGSDIRTFCIGLLIGGAGTGFLYGGSDPASITAGINGLAAGLYFVVDAASAFSRHLYQTHDGVTRRPSLADRIKRNRIICSPPPFEDGKVYFLNNVRIHDLTFSTNGVDSRVSLDLSLEDIAFHAEAKSDCWNHLHRVKQDPLHVLGRAKDPLTLNLIRYGPAFDTSPST